VQRPRVVGVDDDWTIVLMMRDQIESIGYEFIGCIDPLDALAQCAIGDKFAILSDWMMPGGITGLDLLEGVSNKAPSVFRVLVTAAPNDPEVAEAMGLGIVQALLDKPYGLGDLKRVMDSIPRRG
jgi:CheY-like chemotaxis protein